MKNIWWKTLGNKDYHLVLLHGWGLNAGVWDGIIRELVSHFTLHLIDLPGFGRSYNSGIMSLEEMAEQIFIQLKIKSIWLGWSFGGLIASQIALTYPEYVQLLVTVSSSPCFITQENWPGIMPEILTDFQYRLTKNFQDTIDRFFVLQTLGTKTAKKDAFFLKKIFLKLPTLNIEILKNGLEILKNVDFRKSLINLAIPHFRIYGFFDKLVPCKISTILDTYWPNSKSLIIDRASHTPFLSHSKEFCNAIISLKQKIH